ncbi:WD40-repeat-containing domain protein [Mycena rosella]|uniref:WD40-repeat-containing domain protein n=1 Tax=Mycena rosella TaxID=1033263 RepID=A0AAD7CS47_MYCRO|nr:WD40-repeat-containing domain protein [Mycena rosella]
MSGSDDTTLRMWDVRTGTAVGKPLEGHTNYVQSIAFSPNGKLIVSGSNDNTVRIWDASTGIASIHLQSSQSPSHWNIDNDGWISCIPSERLLWLPTHHRPGLWSPYNTLVIGRHQTKLSFDNFVHGTNWSKCWRGTVDI